MKKVLLSALVLIGTIYTGFSQVGFNSLSTLSRPPIFGSSPFQDSLWAMDTTTFQIRYAAGPTLAGFTLTGMTGLTMHPHTGEYFIIMKVSGVSGRVLGKFNPLTGTCIQVGNLGDNFSTISFREDGQLFGVTGDGSSVPETMYLIDQTNATKVVAAALGAGADGEVIAYNYDDDFFYHWSGNGTVVMEKVMSVAPYTATNIVTSGAPGGETFGSIYIGNDKFFNSNISSAFIKVNTSGAYSAQFGNNPDDLRGLGIVGRWVDRTGPAVICADDSSLFTAFATSSVNDRHKYQWVKDGVNIPGATSPDYYANQTGFYNCRIILDSAFTNGQTFDSTITAYTDTAWYGRALLVNPLPVVTITPSPNGYLCFVGDSVQLSATGAVSQQWYRDGGMLPSATGTSIYASIPGLYNMYTIDANGCDDTSATPTAVQLAPTPVISGSTGACFGDSILLTGTDPNASSYNWLLNGSFSTSTPAEMIYVNTAGSYSLETTYGTCIDTSNSIVVSFAPAYGVTPSGAGSICIGSNQLLTATAGGSSYQWLNNGTPIVGATSNTFSATTTGIYTCIITFPGCTDTTSTQYSLTAVDCSGIEEHDAGVINIYPNPVHDKLNISISNDVTIERIEIVDLSGRKIMNSSPNSSNTSINVETLKAGTYLINITSEKGVKAMRFIKY